jgi:hypothetical protein
MARRSCVLFLALLFLRGAGVFADISSAQARTLARFKSQCDAGSGKACYDYGRSLWSVPGAVDRKKAKQFLARGCELKYQLSCDAYNDHNVLVRRHHTAQKFVRGVDAQGGCFTEGDLKTATLKANSTPKNKIVGQKISKIQANSFWYRVGLNEGDVIVKVNNLPFNTSAQVVQALASSGKKFGFEVQRNGETIELWYTCQ